MTALGANRPDPDAELMLRARAGDLGSFEELFRKYMKPLMNFVRRFTGSQAVAEELTQDIFLKVYRARAGYEPKSRFSTYLYRVATNHCLNELRRGEWKARFDPIDASSEAQEGRASAELPDPAPSAEAIAESSQLCAAVEAALASLPENQRAAILLLRYQGLSYEEIAEALGSSVPAVKSLLNRAKNALKDRLAPYLGEDDELRVGSG